MHSPLLGKLLAKENIEIRHGNYQTAWFDIEKRVLGLPLWKEMSKDVYDLLIGHEVGHALDTPFEGWHDSPEKLEGCPRSYINVIEDARIERKQLERYPGLVAPFSRGYKELLSNGFFSDLSDIDWDQVKLIDKINLKTKLRNLIEVPFSDEEVEFYNRSLKTETFEEVVNLVKEIYGFTKENTPDLLTPPPPQENEKGEEENNGEENQDMVSGHDDQIPEDENEKESGEAEQDSETKDESTESDEGTQNSQDEKSELSSSDEETSERTEYRANPEPSDIEESITDKIFRDMERSLIEQTSRGDQPLAISMPVKDVWKECLISYHELEESRNKNKEMWNFSEDSYIEEYKEYIGNVKKSVYFAVKEFEMRKSAYQYQRATTAKTGRIDVNKLWSFKTNEDVFKQVTTLADAKSHGMIMLLDLSGSMSNSLPYVIDQLIHLIYFCKAVKIPFDVYGFTSTNPKFDNNDTLYKKMKDGDLDVTSLSMPQLCSSSLKKKDYENSIFNLFVRKSCPYDYRTYGSVYEDFGSTPLNEALFVCHHLIPEFKAKHQIQKMNFVTFTDGDANAVKSYQSRKLESNKFETSWSSIKAIIRGKMVSGERYTLTEALLKNLKDQYNLNNLGFFMADNSRDYRGAIWRCSDRMTYDEDYKKANKEYLKNKCVTRSNVLGYDHYYIVKGGKNLSTFEGEFEVSSDASKGQLSSAFRKFSKGKKLNKVLMTNFGRHVA